MPVVADDDDVANEGSDAEEDFEAGMRQNAMDFQAQDVDGDHKLDFGEFCALVRDREEGDHTEEELLARFKMLDADGSGKVDLHEYVRWALRDALNRSSSRVIDLFKQWDDDGSGEIDKKEFRKAIKSMGFDFFADDSEIDMVFDDFDLDKSGKLDYKELNKQCAAARPPAAAAAHGHTRHTRTVGDSILADASLSSAVLICAGSASQSSSIPLCVQARRARSSCQQRTSSSAARTQTRRPAS